MPGTLLGRGNILYDFLIAPTLTPISIGASPTVAEQNFTIQGLQATDVCIGWCVNFAFTSVLVVNNVRITAANTMTISFANPSAGALTFPSGQWIFEVLRPENPGAGLPTNAV
jgi:hypothetical protein